LSYAASAIQKSDYGHSIASEAQKSSSERDKKAKNQRHISGSLIYLLEKTLWVYFKDAMEKACYTPHTE
jgi:hypothetical protein